MQLPSVEALQRENDELRATLADKQLATETLRTDLVSLTTKLDTLQLQNTDLESRLEKSHNELTNYRAQIVALAEDDPHSLGAQILKLKAALESKGRDFDYLAGQYQQASASAAEAQGEIAQLKEEVGKLTRRVEGGVKEVSWEGERAGLVARIGELERRCRMLEERERRIEKMDRGE